jgi:hypothetical protein
LNGNEDKRTPGETDKRRGFQDINPVMAVNMTFIPSQSYQINDSFDVARSVLMSTNPSNVYAYFDKCVFLAPEHVMTASLERHLTKLGCDVRPREPRNTRYGHMFAPTGKQIDISVPSVEVLNCLASIPKIRPYLAGPALNSIMPDPESAMDFILATEKCCSQAWSGNRIMISSHSGFYGGQHRAERPYHHPVGYHAKPCKITGAPFCAHLEWRYAGLPALRKIGIAETADFLRFDLKGFWRSHLPLYYMDFERYGMMISNKQTKRKRRTPLIEIDWRGRNFNRDHYTGFIHYKIDSRQQNGEQSLQQFIKNVGRGPYLVKIDMAHILDRIEHVWGPATPHSPRAFSLL